MNKIYKILKLIVYSYMNIPVKLFFVHLLLKFVAPDLAIHLRPRLYRFISFQIGKGTSITGDLSVDVYSGSYSNLVTGARSYISHSCHMTLNAKVTIEDNAIVGPFVKIITDSHTMDNPERRLGPIISKPITIKKGAFIGAGAIILQGVTIGEGAIVGAGAVVARDVPEQTCVVGNPAKNLGLITERGNKPALLHPPKNMAKVS